LTARAFRFANVVGPRQTHGVGYDFVRRLRQDPTRLRILGDGSQSKSYIHVEDILNAMFLANERCPGGLRRVNVATDDYITVREIADLAAEVTGLPAGNAPLRVYTVATGGGRAMCPSCVSTASKIKSLGWSCQRSSATAVRDAMIAMREKSHMADPGSAPTAVEHLLPRAPKLDRWISASSCRRLNEAVTVGEFVDWCQEGLKRAGVTGQILIVR